MVHSNTALCTPDHDSNGYDELCVGAENGFELLPGFCSKFLYCHDERAFGSCQCPDDLDFNPDNKKCDLLGNVGCEEGSPDSRLGPTAHVSSKFDDLCQGIENGLLPHPESCTKFIQCAHEIAYEYECQTDLLFNPQNQTCDLPGNVDCEQGFLTAQLGDQVSLTDTTPEPAANAQRGSLELK